MSSETAELTGPDFGLGVPVAQLADGGMVAGHAGGEPVLVARRGDEFFAVGLHCTHYGVSLAGGLLVGETVRCPWHHACFDLRSGEAVRAPALKPLSRWTLSQRDGLLFVSGKISSRDADRARGAKSDAPPSVVIVGAGAAGDAGADMLRREGYEGAITLIGMDESAPYDRPNLSKDYLAGTASEEWIPLRDRSFYKEHGIELLVGTRVRAIDVAGKRVVLEDGSEREYGALLLATGASPVRLPDEPFGKSGVRYLRTLADSRALIEVAETSGRAVVLGSSFIGLEVAASLRLRGLDVHVVAPEERPLEKVMGRELGDWVRGVHEARGVVFHMGRTARSIEERVVTLDSGERIGADLVVAGIGVRPNDELATAAGLAVDKGIVVNERLETSAPGVFAVGDVARYPDARSGEHIRIEHWVVAQRMGQTAARNILGAAERFDAVPFFWSRHYDDSITYVGHATKWDDVDVSGDLSRNDATVTFRAGGNVLAVATVGRDRANLEAEVALEARPFASPAASGSAA